MILFLGYPRCENQCHSDLNATDDKIMSHGFRPSTCCQYHQERLSPVTIYSHLINTYAVMLEIEKPYDLVTMHWVRYRSGISKWSDPNASSKVPSRCIRSGWLLQMNAIFHKETFLNICHTLSYIGGHKIIQHAERLNISCQAIRNQFVRDWYLLKLKSDVAGWIPVHIVKQRAPYINIDFTKTQHNFTNYYWNVF